VLTDQQNARMMSCAGNTYLQTPAMDGLAARGVRFERAYCTNPLCVPSRFSMLTGRMPSEIGLRGDSGRSTVSVPDHVRRGGLGRLLRDAGYDVAYGGKQHLPKLTAESLGFDYICEDERDELARASADYIRRPHERPFCLVASFINPHDICHMAIRDFPETDFDFFLLEKCKRECEVLDEALQLPPGVSNEEFLARHCPPLPTNFEPQQDEPGAIADVLQAARPFKGSARRRWSEERWRLHRWAYCRLTERVDAQIGQVLDALREAGLAESTLVAFSSDHGDMDGAHRMEHKTAFYEEAARVPFIISLPGITPAGAVDAEHLVSTGLDLLPTLCDFAGAELPEGLHGLSLRRLLEGHAPDRWRDAALVESELGAMAVSGRFKYALYDEGANREQLYDLERDPGETRNWAGEPALQEVLQHHRQLLAELLEQWPAVLSDG
jgi:arylsulfatase A-like enzyme